ncbi:Uncharacterised protein [Mycobacteroides abscessus subsp. massiliense]|nr:Uncharacterised protein [Mycobacteroides abscessus subsp. massiliense]
MRPGHRQVDRRCGGEPLRRSHEGLGLVRVVGALGLTEQGGDPRELLVLCHEGQVRRDQRHDADTP